MYSVTIEFSDISAPYLLIGEYGDVAQHCELTICLLKNKKWRHSSETLSTVCV